jgi:hypothetical protein
MRHSEPEYGKPDDDPEKGARESGGREELCRHQANHAARDQQPSHEERPRDRDEVIIQDGTERFPVHVREIKGDERARWWERAVAAYPPYADYHCKAKRRIPSSSPRFVRGPRCGVCSRDV